MNAEPFLEPRLCVDLDALAANYAALAREAAGAAVAPVLKADAYGIGLAAAAAVLWRAGARSFFVARLSEGEALRAQLGAERPAEIFVLDGCPEGAEARLRAAALTPVLNSLAQIARWRAQGPGPCALHLDTGMNRLGLRAEAVARLAAAPELLEGLELRLVMSHLACSDTPDHPLNARQRQRFLELCAPFPGVPRSLAASGGIFLGRDYHFDLVRPGISLYGGGPFGRPHPGLAPVASFLAPVLDVAEAPAGETIGYGAGFTVDRPLRLAIVACGYADGVLRSSAGHGYGWLHGALRRSLGRISMDLLVLDITGCDAARAGDLVELVGAHLPVDEAALQAGTIAYELLARLGARHARQYRGRA